MNFRPVQLLDIQTSIERRTFHITSAHENWPCRKGCSDCCRHLASEPRVSESEWRQMESAIDALPVESASAARRRIHETAGRERPVICPLLDTETDACLIYDARPIACRAYGFYAERDKVLGCSQIESLARETPDVVWGNHAALDAQTQELGVAAPLSEWLATPSATPADRPS